MRNLTILRERSFIACLGKMKVYIEAPASNELKICGVPCRKLGTLKNGEQKTFSIEEDACRIYVIADTVTKDYCNEVYELPAGAEDIYLTGRNCYEPTRGNAFRFAYNDSENVLRQRKHGKKIGLIVMICAVLTGALIGYFITHTGTKIKEKTFTEQGVSITLTTAFSKLDDPNENVLLCYSAENKMVFFNRDSFSDYEELKNYSLDRYSRLMISKNQLDTTLQHTASGIPCFDYQGTLETGLEYAGRVYVYRTEDAFWMVQFITDADIVDSMYAQFDAWADTVTFTHGQ